MRGCPALNSRGEPCRMWPSEGDGCVYHTGNKPILPGAVQLRRGRARRSPPKAVEVPRYNPDFLPSMKRHSDAMWKLRAWAGEFDALDEERYTALQFIEWVELEIAPPVEAKDAEPAYRVVGAAAVALRG